jgi:hypothetical protein
MKFKDLRSPFSELNTIFIEVDSYAIVGTSSLLTRFAMAGDDTQGLSMSTKTDATALTTSFSNMLVWHQSRSQFVTLCVTYTSGRSITSTSHDRAIVQPQWATSLD